MKHLASLVLLSAMGSYAVAQSPAPAPDTRLPTAPPAATGPSGTTTAPMTETMVPGATGNIVWYQRANDDWPVSEIIGTQVLNTAGEDIGDVNELILSNDGKIRAVIIGVGGFLGMGERDVAVAFDSLKIARDKDNDEVITVDASKEALKSAPRWDRLRPSG